MSFFYTDNVVADNDKPIHVGQLPTKAQTLITTYLRTIKSLWLRWSQVF